jgi:polyhydroxyalkanoate synthesis regulator phasin
MKERLIALFVTAVVLTSCAGLTQVTVPQSNINYMGKDIETCRRVEFTLIKTYFLGIGGMSERARNTNIIDELIKKANLQTNESLAYISVSRNINTYIFITEVKFTASGYVVRPKQEGGQEVIQEVKEEDTYNLTRKRATPKQMKQLYNSYKRRLYHALTWNDVLKIKEDVDNDRKAGKLSPEQAQKLLDMIYQRL